VFDGWGNELFSIDLSPSPTVNLRRIAVSRASGRYVVAVKGSWFLADLVLVRDGSEQWRVPVKWFLDVAISPSGGYVALVELKSKFVRESAKIKLFSVRGDTLELRSRARKLVSDIYFRHRQRRSYLQNCESTHDGKQQMYSLLH